MDEEIYFENVRRTALVLTPKQPFYDWANSVNNDSLENAGPIGEPDVYLLPDFETMEEMEKWLKKNFDSFFCEQMNNWYVDEDLWVKNRSFKLFKDWFDYSLHTMVWDSLDAPIDKLG